MDAENALETWFLAPGVQVGSGNNPTIRGIEVNLVLVQVK